MTLIIKKAYTENRILITNDKDFGEKVFKEKLPHHGVIFLRLSDERAKIKISVIQRLLEQYGDHLAEEFVVATESGIRIAGIS